MGFHCCFFDEGRTFKDGFKNGQILHKMNLWHGQTAVETGIKLDNKNQSTQVAVNVRAS